MDWLRIAAPFFGQLFQERGDELQKARERTLGLAEDKYKRYAANQDFVGQQTLKEMMAQEAEARNQQSPAYQQNLATGKAQEQLATVGAAGKQADIDERALLSDEEKRRLQIAPALQSEAYSKQVGLQEKERNKTPSQVHLENEQKWVDMITSPTFVANPDYEAAYQASLVLGLDSEPKSAGYSARFAGWFKGPYARRDTARVKAGEGATGVDAVGAPPNFFQNPAPAPDQKPPPAVSVSEFLRPTFAGGTPDRTGSMIEGAGVAGATAAPAPDREQKIRALMLKRNPNTGQRFTRQEAEATTDSLMNR